ncbi:hypothetical protein BDR03DRAFT_947474, partial [Suillus americanus]
MEYSADEIAAARSLQYLAAYDYVCSFHEEWNFLCRSRWTEVKVLYIIARYVPFLLIITDVYLNFSPNENPKVYTGQYLFKLRSDITHLFR